MAGVFIIDTNVLVAGLITREAASPVAVILDAMLTGELVYVLSPALLHEYRAVLLRPKMCSAHGLSEAQVDTMLTEIVANAAWREPPAASAQGAPDPGDDTRGRFWPVNPLPRWLRGTGCSSTIHPKVEGSFPPWPV